MTSLDDIQLPIPPPEGFDPLKASDDDLLKHGFPPRPDAESCPNLHASWERMLSRPLTYVPAEPEIMEVDEGRDPILTPEETLPQPPQGFSGPTKAPKEQMHLKSNIWSGAVNIHPFPVPKATFSPSTTFPDPEATRPLGKTPHSAPEYKFKYITGSWKVSRAFPQNWARVADAWTTQGVKGADEFKAGTWVGLDGYHTSKDVLQAGTAQRCVVKSDGSVEHNTWAWFEWYPAPPVRFRGFEVQPGDTIHVHVGVYKHFDPLSRRTPPKKPETKGFVFFYNESNCTYTSVFFNPPPGVSFKGDTAEWVIEGHRPKTRGYPSMSYLGTTFISDCLAIAEAEDAKGKKMFVEKNLQDALLIDLVQNRKLLSWPKKENDSVLSIYSQGREVYTEVKQE